MKCRVLALSLILLPLFGCGAVSGPPVPPAPGYSSPADQVLGQSLAAVTAFRDSEKDNYQCGPVAAAAKTCLSDAQKAAEKSSLNTLIDTVDVANVAYLAFHAGTQTLAQAQAAATKAQNAQNVLTVAKGVK